MTERVRAAGYVRVSTDEQAREGYGLDAQRRAIELCCEARDWSLVNTYDDPGVSGKSIKGRTGLAALMAAARRRDFDCLVVLKLDRLSRSLRDVLEVCGELEEHQIQCVSIHEGFDSGTIAGRMHRNILGTFAEFERETIVERIKVGIREKAQQGELVGPLPLGYRRDDDGRVVAEQVIAPLVREMFGRYAEGDASLRDMAQWAAQVGLVSTKGNPLDRLSIRKMLTNVTYTGQVSYYTRRGGGAIGNGKHPALVDAVTFATVQEVLRARRRSDTPKRPFGREPYPLSQVAVCAYDNSPMVGTKASKSGRAYMRCSTAQRRGRAACEQRMVPAELLEAQVAAYMTGIRFPSHFLGEVVAELRRREQPHVDEASERRRVERELEQLRKQHRWGDIGDKEYKRETAPLKQRLAELDRPLVVLDVEKAVRFMRQMGESWKNADRAARRAFVCEVFQRIEIHDDQVLSLTPKLPYGPLFEVDRRERFGGEGGVVWLPGLDSNQQHLG